MVEACRYRGDLELLVGECRERRSVESEPITDAALRLQSVGLSTLGINGKPLLWAMNVVTTVFCVKSSNR